VKIGKPTHLLTETGMSACGIVGAEITTPNPESVNCYRCKATRLFKSGVNDLNPNTRSTKVSDIINTYYDKYAKVTSLVDIVTDIKHYCRVNEIDLNDVERIARNHFQEESQRYETD